LHRIYVPICRTLPTKEVMMIIHICTASTTYCTSPSHTTLAVLGRLLRALKLGLPLRSTGSFSTRPDSHLAMSDDLTPLSLPTTLPYPITLTRLHARSSQSISRGSPLISYTFTSSTNRRELARLEKGLQPSEGVRREDVKEGDMSAVWECGLEGEFVRWEKGIEVGRVVERKHAS
jgi:hypothetical protein